MEPQAQKDPKIIRVGTYKDDWSGICSFCGEDQSSHRTLDGPYEGELLESRKPCEPEVAAITRHHRNIVSAQKWTYFSGWVLFPFLILFIHEIEIIALIALVFACLKFIWETVKVFGRPRKWFPAYGRWIEAKEAESLRKRHFIYHCERNPEGFERLRAENFAKER
jgi:hypothetical protein